MLTSTRTAVTVLLMSISLSGVAAPGLAETQWKRQHPRRDQANHRLANRNRRIRTEVAEGEMTKGQAAAPHREDRQIRHEERMMASQNNGHITRQELKTLNQQENAVSAQIGR